MTAVLGLRMRGEGIFAEQIHKAVCPRQTKSFFFFFMKGRSLQSRLITAILSKVKKKPVPAVLVSAPAALPPTRRADSLAGLDVPRDLVESFYAAGYHGHGSGKYGFPVKCAAGYSCSAIARYAAAVYSCRSGYIHCRFGQRINRYCVRADLLAGCCIG